MAKEVIRPEQFAKVDVTKEAPETLELTPEQQQEMEALFGDIFETLAQGKLVKGKIVKSDSDGVLVDISYKSYGLIPRYEFTSHELQEFKSGNEIEVILDEFENVEGNVVLSYEKAKALKAWDEITKLHTENKPVEGTVTHKVKGGLSVDVGIPAFLPGSQIDLQRVTDFDHWVGKPIQALILKINKKRGNIIISRRKLLSDQRSEKRKEILETLEESQVIQGQVKNITNYGVFVDIGGVDGLLHITDMTWGRIAHPSELVKIGDTTTVKILSFDKDNEKISLGLKQLSDNPWEAISKELKVGDRVKGTISSITDYGLFIEVRKGVEGLVHISEISWIDRIDDINEKHKVGQELEALIVALNPENRRMSLSIKQLGENPWKAIDEKFKVGQKIKGTISNITDFGIFVQLLPGIDGLVHISDLSWTEHINHPGNVYHTGDEVEAVVLSIDKDNKKISLGIKQLADDPWKDIEKQFKIGSTVEGEVAKITNFGAFIKLPSGIEGLVHISELSDQNVEKVEDVLEVGQKTEFKVINVNKDDRKLGLSLKTNPEKRSQKTSPSSTKLENKKIKPHTPSKGKGLLQQELEKHALDTKKKKKEA